MKMTDIEEFLYGTTGLTPEMYHGNIPAGKGMQNIDGEFYDRWVTQWGGGQTSGDEIVFFDFSLNQKVTIYIVGSTLWIVDIRYSGKPDVWDWCNDGTMQHHSAFRHELEQERIKKYLNTKIPNCKIWDMVQKRAWELYFNAN